MHVHTTTRALALGAVLTLLATGCATGSPSASGGSPSASPTDVVTTAPATPSASAEPSASSTPEPTVTADANDPGDGVVRDEPVTVPSPSDNAQIEVTPVITRWGVEGETYVVAGVLDGLVEEHGTCTLTLTAAGMTATAEGPATRSATSMNCADDLAIPLTELASGEWSATIAYESESYAGASAAKTVEVP